ncbi:hypothetical protein [Rhodococcus rhodochrous]|nr:hypothetical protein [Rhodococcus rhodochrous]
MSRRYAVGVVFAVVDRVNRDLLEQGCAGVPSQGPHPQRQV